MESHSNISFREKLLQRLGQHYVLAMMLITRVAGAGGGLLVIYYVELTLDLSDHIRFHFRLGSIVVVIFALTITTSFALWETRRLRRVMRKLRTHETILPEDARAAGRESVLFVGRHHRLEAWLVPATTLVPLLFYLSYLDGVDTTVMFNISLAVFMGVAMALMSTFFAVEHFMKPLIRHLLDCGIPIDYRTLPAGRLNFRFGLCFALIISVTALMIGTLARQRANDIIARPDTQRYAVEHLIRHSTYITFAAVITGIAYSRLLTNSVASRLDTMVRSMGRVSRGNFSERLSPTGNDEVDILSRQFNAMVGQLERDNRTIRELNTTLEEKVRLRTGQLEKTVQQLRSTQQQLTDYNREIEAARLEAESANEAKSIFLANISHELRTPLNGVIGMTDLLLTSSLESQQRRYAETVKESGTTLLRLLNDVLDFSKMEAGKMEVEMIDFSLREAVEPVVEAASFRCRNSQIEISLFLDPNIPDTLHGDPGRIRQVLSNLINNALKFTQTGSVIVRITAEATADKYAHVQFSVRDTGIGIPEDRVDRLFQSFSQVDASTTRRFGGTGLGLAICKQLCELMGGEIGFESKVGQGSRFWFTLPLALSESSYEPSPIRQLTEQIQGMPVLVIDDKPDSRETLAEQLNAWGFQTETAHDSATAKELVTSDIRRQKPHQIVFVNGDLPEFDPAEFLSIANQNAAKTACHLLALLPVGSLQTTEEILQKGFSDYINKPVVQSTLFDAILGTLVGRDSAVVRPLVNDYQRITGPHSDGSSASYKGIHILLAEDNEINQEVAAGFLKQSGFTVSIVDDGLKAIDALRTQPIHLVLMDCQMPVMDGITATKEIRRLEASGEMPYSGSMPIIALTANAMSGDRQRCLQTGMTDFLSKPLEPVTLVGTIETCLEHSRLHRTDSENLPNIQSEISVVPARHDGKQSSPREKPEQPSTRSAEQTDLLQVIDYQSLVDRCLGNVDLVSRILTKFDERADAELERLADGLSEGNAETVSRYAHSLKGAAGNISADSIRTISSRLEQLGRDGTLDGAETHLRELHDEINKLRRDITVLSTADAITESLSQMQEAETGEEPCES